MADIDLFREKLVVTNEEIDEIVYGLYGVTEEERKIIEGVDV